MPGKLNNFVQNLIIEYKLTQSLLLTSPMGNGLSFYELILRGCQYLS